MSDLRTRVIRLAATFPAKSQERRTLLALLDEQPSRQKKALQMESNASVIPILNSLLRREMTVTIQYMVQAEMCANWGYTKLAGLLKMQAIQEMKHAEKEIERIIYLEGVPDVGTLEEIHIGADVDAMLRNNWAAERDAVARYNAAIALCYKVGDNGTRTLLEPILSDEEKHLDEDQSRIEQIEKLGLERFLAEML